MSEKKLSDDLLVLKNVKKHYPLTKGFFHRHTGSIKAVDGLDLTIRRGETLGLVGESGCGKSTLGRLIVRLEEPTGGEIIFDGKNAMNLSGKQMLDFRRRVQIIFQDPYSSLNPRQTIGRIISEGLAIHNIGTPAERRERVRHIMEVVGLHADQANRYPHEFSGGQRQRIGIARALALQPELIVCDEPLSALDVSIQAQVINLLMDLQEEFNLTYLFISHDLSVVKHITDRVAVMYLGSLVELADKKDLFDNPRHPYTQTLLQAVPIADPKLDKRRRDLLGDLPSPLGGLGGCRFKPRCAHTRAECKSDAPHFKNVGQNHWVRCYLYEEDEDKARASVG